MHETCRMLKFLKINGLTGSKPAANPLFGEIHQLFGALRDRPSASRPRHRNETAWASASRAGMGPRLLAATVGLAVGAAHHHLVHAIGRQPSVDYLGSMAGANVPSRVLASMAINGRDHGLVDGAVRGPARQRFGRSPQAPARSRSRLWMMRLALGIAGVPGTAFTAPVAASRLLRTEHRACVAAAVSARNRVVPPPDGRLPAGAEAAGRAPAAAALLQPCVGRLFRLAQHRQK